MEQQTIFLRKLLGLPNPNNPVIKMNNGDFRNDTSCEFNDCYSENMITGVNERTNNLFSKGAFAFNVKGTFYSNYTARYPYGNCVKSKFSPTSRNGYVKPFFANGYWKREGFVNEGNKTRKLWNQTESKNGSLSRSKVSSMFKTPYTDNKKSVSVGLKDQFKGKEYSLEKELLDESALEAFPTFEESKLHKLQKNILKAPLIQTAPIKKESFEEIKMKFQLWSHDVTTKSTSLNKKKDSKKAESMRMKIMKPPSRFIRNGINRKMRENDESRLELIYESILKDDMKDVLNSNSDVSVINNSRSFKNGFDYFPEGFKCSLKSCSTNEAVLEKEKNSYSNYNSRFLIPNNFKLPKAFGSGCKILTQNGFFHSAKVATKLDSVPNHGLPKAFNSTCKNDNQEHNCHQSHRNVNLMGSSKGSSGSDNISRKNPPCSIMC